MDQTKSSVSDASDQSKNIVARSQRINIQTAHDVLLIWLDDNSTAYRNTLIQLQQADTEIEIFTDPEECFNFIDNIDNTKVCMIVSSSFGELFVSCIHDMSQVDSIFICYNNKMDHVQWIKQWPKIKGVFTETILMREALKKAVQQCEQSAISISFVPSVSDDDSKQNLDELDPMFMYSQILKETLLTIKFDDECIKQFTDHCRNLFTGNDQKLDTIDKLKIKYHQKTPIWWYTSEIYLYRMLNRSLRLMNMDMIIKMGFFITDLHRQIEQLHFEQFSDDNSKKPFELYRGQGMSETDFEQMRKIQGGLMSFNNFLSTSKDREVSYCFAESSSINPELIGILFIMTIDPKKAITPFASIIDVGYFGNQEDEVLFSMHSVFRIGEIKSIGDTQRLFQVNLTLTDDNDRDLSLLTDHIRKETFENEKGWYRLGSLLLKVGEPTKAFELYKTLLQQKTNVSDEARIYHQLGWAKSNQGEYQEATVLYQKALNIYKEYLPSTHSILATCYHNISSGYFLMGDYSKALSSHEKALEIQKQSLPLNHPDLATPYNNIGLVYSNMGNYSKALSYYEKALEIRKQSLPSNHPDLATSYNNIGSVYDNMGDYLKALSSHKKALEIQKQSLPSNHPDLASTYNNIGLVYDNMGDYRKALSSHEKALEIQKQSLPSNHPHLATYYNNIGLVYDNMGDYQKALSSHEKALEIQKQSLPSNHPHLAAYYNNIGSVYDNMGDYQKALSSYEKALEIQKQSLPSNHPHLATYYNNIGVVYNKMNDYRKARSFYERAVEVGQQSLLVNHPNLQMYKRNLDRVKSKL